MSPIPEQFRHVFWAYDPTRLDLARDKRLIITQILNRGNAAAVRWLRSTYSNDDIRVVISAPGRGLWFPQVLNFWVTVYGIKIPSETYDRALFSLAPRSLPLP